jgi:hypothetical protein
MATAAREGWRSRIVGHGEEAPDQLLANPANWRIHPKPQQDALAGVLDQIGWVQDVIVNRATGHVIDGHLRELEPSEEALILATIDPLAAMAATDREQLAALLEDVSTGDAALQAMLDQLAQDAGLVPPVDPMAEWQGMPSFEQEDQSAYRTIYVHFDDIDAIRDFERLVGQQITDEAKSIWYPERKPQSRGEFVSDEF